MESARLSSAEEGRPVNTPPGDAARKAVSIGRPDTGFCFLSFLGARMAATTCSWARGWRTTRRTPTLRVGSRSKTGARARARALGSCSASNPARIWSS